MVVFLLRKVALAADDVDVETECRNGGQHENDRRCAGVEAVVLWPNQADENGDPNDADNERDRLATDEVEASAKDFLS